MESVSCSCLSSDWVGFSKKKILGKEGMHGNGVPRKDSQILGATRDPLARATRDPLARATSKLLGNQGNVRLQNFRSDLN